LITWSVFC